MDKQIHPNKKELQTETSTNREHLLADLPVTEKCYELAGLSTAVLAGGDGPPVILLHGPGETSVWWMRVIPKLVKTHKVIVPDLPGHGSSRIAGGTLNADIVFEWLSKLIEHTCPTPPVLVGNILGGSIAARFSVNHGEQVGQLILVNSLGLGKFRPAPSFAFRLFRFMIWPTEKNFDRFFPHCMYDVDDLRSNMGKYWEPFIAYNLECANDKESSNAMQFLMKTLGIPKIPEDDLEKIDVSTALIWGRHDKANKLSIAEATSERHGWPLYVIENARDDPKLEQPEAFVKALYTALENSKDSIEETR
ncbi:alpha/beta hydrolase [Aliifodinibius sp. S!AR15-10]|uniref:alpha/beta fold hydrolase n=1 Tax=Aliifodinibius sp. S!AR15-10 TaxID=2950437 RepID=UPI002863E764|nr:alpha/beta hydrolase [Aliifodinibius sp. S!AR15-10]MDR8390505.1 alpha/beta hydrolase [Aliifodinibius sp. S!AR15-10]